jgi:hypothetical protein
LWELAATNLEFLECVLLAWDHNLTGSDIFQGAIAFR